MALDRGWVRTLDPADSGIRLGWADGAFAGRAVSVPDVANAEGGAVAQRGSIAWYRTTLRPPAGGDWQLTFGSANFDATVWLDGHRLGKHRGAYDRFSFTLRGLKADAPHRLVVRVDYRNPDRQTALGFHRAWFNWGGINRAVQLRPLDLSELSESAVQTTVDNFGASVRVGVSVRNRTAKPRTIAVSGSLGSEELRFPPVAVPAHAVARVRTDLHVPAKALWSPGHPRMHALRLTVDGETARTDAVGLRELRVSKGKLLVNGSTVRVDGASIHEDVLGRGDALTPADQDQLVAQLKSIGAVATRAQHSLDPGLLDRLDRAGILVWQGAGPFASPGQWSFGDSARRTADAEARTIRQVRAERLHPSIVAWNLVNEVRDNGASDAQVAYVRRMARQIHRLDHGRLVAVDVWGKHVPTVAGQLYAPLDAVGLTDYSGWYSGPLASRTRQIADTERIARRFATVFEGKLRVVTEFGAGASGRNPDMAVGGYGYQSQLIADHLAIYRRTPGISGAIVWALRDFAMTPDWSGGSLRLVAPAVRKQAGLNDKGLFTRGNRPKQAALTVRREFGVVNCRNTVGERRTC